MLTIKYRMSDGAEFIEDGFESVSSSVGEFEDPNQAADPSPSDPLGQRGRIVLRRTVTGLKPITSVVYGPVFQHSDPNAPTPGTIPTIWVMNETGATVAKYDL